MISNIYDMKLHAVDCVDNETQVMRVPGGWIYSRYDGFQTNRFIDPCFIPFNNEFMEQCAALKTSGTQPTAINTERDAIAALCKRCPYGDQCKAGEQPGSNHCFACNWRRVLYE